MNELREEARESIRYHIWSGHYGEEEVFTIVDEDVFDPDSEEENCLRDAIRREFRKKREAEREWPEITNCDRLDRAFEALRAESILVWHRCGFTQQDGLEVIEDLYKEEGGERSDVLGYCFYTLQDMEGAMWGGADLWLAFGCFSPCNENVVRIGQLIRQEIKSHGFDVEWDGTAESRLLINGFQWQRRSPGA